MLVRHVKYAMKKDHNVYIGRGDEQRKRSPLSNPFWIRNDNDDAERKASIEQYRVWLWKKMQDGDPVIWDALRSIRATSVLLCHCHPKPCHGHVVVKAWTWAYTQGLIEPHHANHDSTTLATIAHATEKEREKETGMATGPRDMAALMTSMAESLKAKQTTRKAQMDAALDEHILATMPEQPEPANALYLTLPPKRKQGRGAPRMLRALLPPAPDIRYNVLDEIALDLAELASVA